MIDKGLWYFAHPYTAKDKDGNYVPSAEEANFHLANMLAAELIKRGYNVYSPISHTHPIHRACPEFLKHHEHELWYRLDNEMIDKTDWVGIIMAPGWEQSKGCLEERFAFQERGKWIRCYGDIIKTSSEYKQEG